MTTTTLGAILGRSAWGGRAIRRRPRRGTPRRTGRRGRPARSARPGRSGRGAPAGRRRASGAAPPGAGAPGGPAARRPRAPARGGGEGGIALGGGHVPAPPGGRLGEEPVRRAHVERLPAAPLPQPGEDDRVARVRVVLEPVDRFAHSFPPEGQDITRVPQGRFE